MRRTVRIMGVGNRQQGTSGKGRPYDFVNVSISYDDPYFTGTKAETVGIDTPVIGDRVLTPGDDLDVEMWSYNFRTRIGCIYG